jgi:hypothetical protein
MIAQKKKHVITKVGNENREKVCNRGYKRRVRKVTTAGEVAKGCTFKEEVELEEK